MVLKPLINVNVDVWAKNLNLDERGCIKFQVGLYKGLRFCRKRTDYVEMSVSVVTVIFLLEA